MLKILGSLTLYILGGLALPALLGLVVVSVYQPDALIEHPWIEHLLWTSLGAGLLKAALDLFHCVVLPISATRLRWQRRNRDRSTCESTAV